MSNRLPHRHLSGRFDGSRKNPAAHHRAYESIHRVNHQAVDTLVRAGLWPRAIGVETVTRLIGTIFRHSAQAAECGGRFSGHGEWNISSSQLSIEVSDDKSPARSGRPYLTTIADRHTGRIVAYALGFTVPTWAVLRNALAGLPPHHTGIAYLDLFEVLA